MMIKNHAYSKDNSTLSFTIEKTTPAFVNAVRRSVISLVPTLAIEEVEFQENSSALYDEVIAHRLGLLPLTTPIGEYKLRSEFPDDGVARAECEVKLTLEAEGPKTVYAEDLVSKDPAVKCAYPKMVIVKLLKDQSIKLEATAILGQGVEHAKWSAANAYYQYAPVVVTGSKKQEVLPKDILGLKSQEVFSVNGKVQNPRIDAENATVEHSKDNIIFTIESWGQMQAKDVLKQAVEQLNIQLNGIQEAIQAIGTKK
ncbi:MAG: DNA-directed RNA polymerase subunit D [Candidatus Woesearchaeota archaeon]